jgi:hypothetical protein
MTRPSAAPGQEAPLTFGWSATFAARRASGRYEFEVIGWSARRRRPGGAGRSRRSDAGVDVAVELLGGEAILGDVLARAGRAAKPAADPADLALLESALRDAAGR